MSWYTKPKEGDLFHRYESLPRQISAVRFTNQNKGQIFNELTGQFAASLENDEPILKVITAHGDIAIVRLGDWIVKDIKLGTYYPVKNEAFCDNYV